MQLSSSVAELSCDETMDPPAEDLQQVLSIDQIRSIRASNNYVERPASCFHAMSLLSLLMPCLCCYFPTLGCLKLCQRGYDGLRRPGCRCQSHTNTVCRKISSSSGTPFPKTLDKPV
ncbi:PREDICTED: protein sprouty homolog 3 [Chaetura pelagica]|uniref:protein sprouty homolog 3 n=1 Tax=Chaetura pelagica TaxID=8897 RepID=UPI000523BFF0|nr:PREDICTED: protein sprouty homolog 3 [Chaetura pelagica]